MKGHAEIVRPCDRIDNRESLAFRAIETIPQHSAFLTLVKGHDGTLFHPLSSARCEPSRCRNRIDASIKSKDESEIVVGCGIAIIDSDFLMHFDVLEGSKYDFARR
jgi:hypothetical protein